MGTAWTYSTNPNDEHDAVREAAGMFDMSPVGPEYSCCLGKVVMMESLDGRKLDYMVRFG
jgi:hypothetical protein